MHNSDLSNQTSARSDRYVSTFDARGDLYNAASSIQPRAREVEREILIDLLDIAPELRICDVPAGGGYLADGIAEITNRSTNIYCVEPSKKFSEPVAKEYQLFNCPISDIPVDDNFFDRVGSLAGLHHVDQKLPFFQEACRILAPQGRIAVADVLAETPIADFLNGPVDQFTESGHEGIFIELGEFTKWFRQSGLTPVSEEYREFYWEFESELQMVDYCKCLFGMTKANRDQVQSALHQHFAIEKSDGKTRLPWGLLYGVAVCR